MQKDYIFYLACFLYFSSFMSIFIDEKMPIPKDWRHAYRLFGFMVLSTPIYGRIFGWW